MSIDRLSKLPSDVLSHIYDFVQEPSKTALISKEHQKETYRAIYGKLWASSKKDPFFTALAKEVGSWNAQNPASSIQQLSRIFSREVPYCLLRQTFAVKEKWESLGVDPSRPRANLPKMTATIQRKKAFLLVQLLRGLARFYPHAKEFQKTLDPTLPLEERAQKISAWLQEKGGTLTPIQVQPDDENGRHFELFLTRFRFLPAEALCLRMWWKIPSSLFYLACKYGHFDMIQAIMNHPTKFDRIDLDDIQDGYLQLCKRHPEIAYTVLKNQRIQRLADNFSFFGKIVDSIAINGSVKLLRPFMNHSNFQRHQGAVLRRASHAGHDPMVQILLPKSSLWQLGSGLFMAVEGPTLVSQLVMQIFLKRAQPPPLSPEFKKYVKSLSFYVQQNPTVAQGISTLLAIIDLSQSAATTTTLGMMPLLLVFTGVRDGVPNNTMCFQSFLWNVSASTLLLGGIILLDFNIVGPIMFLHALQDDENCALTRVWHAIVGLLGSMSVPLSIMGFTKFHSVLDRKTSLKERVHQIRNFLPGRCKVIQSLTRAIWNRLPCINRPIAPHKKDDDDPARLQEIVIH